MAMFDAPVAHRRSAPIHRGAKIPMHRHSGARAPMCDAAKPRLPERRTPPHRGSGDLCASGVRGCGAIGSRLRKCWPRFVGACYSAK